LCCNHHTMFYVSTKFLELLYICRSSGGGEELPCMVV
jgi:hypothetical protein